MPQELIQTTNTHLTLGETSSVCIVNIKQRPAALKIQKMLFQISSVNYLPKLISLEIKFLLNNSLTRRNIHLSGQLILFVT